MVTLIRDFRAQPLELFDGMEPVKLMLDPRSFDMARHEPVDLLANMMESNDPLPPELPRQLQAMMPPRVRAFNKSSACWESRLGEYALLHSASSNETLVILFSFFEVSAGRYNSYLHAVGKFKASGQVQ